MSTRSPQVEVDEVVVVRLSQVSQELRLQAADVLIRKAGLDTFAAIELSMAAAAPVEDPYLIVPGGQGTHRPRGGPVPGGPVPGVLS